MDLSTGSQGKGRTWENGENGKAKWEKGISEKEGGGNKKWFGNKDMKWWVWDKGQMEKGKWGGNEKEKIEIGGKMKRNEKKDDQKWKRGEKEKVLGD